MIRVTYADTGETPAPANPEYLRRNLLHAAAIGAVAGATTSIERLKGLSCPPQWLVCSLEGVLERANRVANEMAKHRDEVPKVKP